MSKGSMPDNMSWRLLERNANESKESSDWLDLRMSWLKPKSVRLEANALAMCFQCIEVGSTRNLHQIALSKMNAVRTNALAIG